MPVLVYRITDAGFARITDNSLDLRVIDEIATPITLFVPGSGGDISTIWQPSLSHADWVMAGPLLRSGDNLATQVLISLFSDRLAAADDPIPDNTDDRRGWWGDTGETYPIGSRLWLLDRAKLTQDTPLKCKNYIDEALQWMIGDGVAASIVTETAIQLPSMLAARVTISRQDGTRIAQNFAWVWKEIN